MKLKLFKRKAKEPSVDTRIDAKDHQFTVQCPRPEPHVPLRLAGLSPIPKWTHPGKKGKVLVCRSCGGDVRVFHFSWTTLTCTFCGANTEKGNWLLAAQETDEE